MKGLKLVVLSCLSIVTVMIFYLMIFADINSWSEAAKSDGLRWVLSSLLSAIVVLLIASGYGHKYRDKEILKNWKLPNLKTIQFKKPFISIHKKNIDFRQLSFLSACLFMGIIIFDLGGGSFAKAGHYVVTGLGAFCVYLLVVKMQEQSYIRAIYKVAFIVSSLIWVLGLFGNWFNFRIFTVFDGENAFMITSSVWFISQLKNIGK